MKRVRAVFTAAPAGQARVLVVHHNVLRGEISRRMGLARWRQAQRRIVESGAEVVLCGHDHQEGARSEEHTSELQSRGHLVCRLLLEKKKKKPPTPTT